MLTAIHQVRRPRGAPTRDDFTFVTSPLPHPAEGQVLVENLYLSVDPYMRELMDEGGWALGTPLEGRAIGRVVESTVPALPAGTTVLHRQGWRTHALLTAEDARRLDPPSGVPLSAYLGILGGTGLTAYVGLTRVARLQPGDDLFVSAAAGAVGGAVGQLGRLLGAGRIVGSTGSAEKVAHLTGRLGFDAAFDYHTGAVADLLAEAAPDGIDVCFDNVGGDHLAAAISVLRPHGRIAWCGAIGQYDNATAPPAAPRNLYDIVGKSIRLEGFLVREHVDAREEFERYLVPRVQRGEATVEESVVDGFEYVVDAFLGMLRGDNVGKTIVRTNTQ